MAYGSKDERKARMKAAVERQMREHPEWYDGSYNDSPTGGYTQKSVKAEAETAVKAAQQSEYRLKRLAEQRAAMEQRNAAGRAAATGALAGIAGRYTYDNAGKVRTVQPETLYSVSDKFPYSYHAAKQAKANGLTERDLQVRMKIAGELLEQAGVQQWAQKEKERLLKLDVAATEEKIAATQALLEKVDSDKNAMPVDEYENLERHVTATVARLRQDIRLHERYMTEQGYMQAPDFAFYSRMGAEMKNPTWEEANSGFSIGRWRPFAKEIANPVTFSQDKENLGKAALQQATPGGGDGLVNSSYQYMEKYETAIYNYILAKEGKEKAQDYLDLIQEGLNARSGAAMAEQMAGNRLEQLAFGAIAGLDQFASGIKQSLSKEALPATEIQYASGAVREDLGNWGLQLPDWLGGSTLGQVAYDAVTTGTNMAPSILLSQVTGYLGGASWLAKGAGSLSMGISSGGNAYNEMLKQGYDPDQARNYALLVGASESGLSYLLGGISKLGGKVTGQAAQTAIRNIDNAFVRIAVEGIINTTGEGVEEYLQEILEPAFRNLCFGEDNEIRLFTPEAAYSYLLGALTAGIMEGPSTIKKGLSASRRGKCVALAGKTNELIERAAQSPDRETANLALEMQQGRVRINNSNLGELLTAYDDAGGDLSFMKEFNAQASSDAKVASAQEAETDPLRQAAYQAAGGKAQAESAQTARETGRTPAGLGAEATFNESGARARVTGIDSVEDGTVYVRLEDGSTAAADDLSFDDPALDRLYGEAGMLDAQGARSFIAGYDGTTAVPAYASGFMAAYGAARTGKSQDQARMASPYAAGLPAASFQYAYAAGENARSGAGQDAGPKYSIRYDSENRPYVEVDEDILAGVPRKDWVKTVRGNLAKKFPNGVTVGNHLVKINQKSRQEMTYSKYMQWAMKHDASAYSDKLRATHNADEILRASRNYINEAPMHPRKDSIQQFARGEVQLRVGKNDYTASVIVATAENGQMTLYDVINLHPTAISERQKKGHSVTANANAQPLESAVSTDSVPQKGKAVNSSIRREGAKDVRPGLTRAYQVDKLTEAAKAALKKNRVQLKLIDYMARRYGVEVVLTDTLKGMTLGGTVIETDANGLYDPESGKIYLSVTAQGGAFAYVAMHEMAHYIRAWNREGYKALQRAVQAALEANGQDVEALARYQMEQFGYDEEAALEEVVANSLPAVLADEGFVRELTQTNRRLAMKVRDFLHDLVKNLKDALDKLAQSRSWKQMAALREDLDSLRDMERAFTAAMEGTQSAGGLAEAVSDARYSLNPDFARQYDNWDGKDPHTVFTIGTTSKALVSIGIKDSRILWDGSKIAKIKVKHPGMTDAIIKQVPNIIENPVLVMQSQQADSRIVMFGEVFDANNIPVLAVLELNPTLRGQYDMNIIKIASAYGKDTNPQRLINTSMILYVDPNKNRTDRWLKRTRLQLPFKLQHYGSIGSVTYPEDAVNASIRQNGGKDAKAGAAAAPSGAGNIESRGKQAAKQSAKDEAGYAYAKKNLATDESLYHYEFLIHLQDQQVTRLAEVSSLQDENGRLDTNAILKKAHENLAQEGQTDGTGKNWVTNAYTARPLRVDNSTIRHSLNGEHRRILTNARIAASIGTIIKNAVPINALHNAAEGVIGTYAMVSYANDSKGREFIAIITVEQRTGEINGLTTFDVAHSASGRQKKSSQADTKSQGVNPIKAATISIRKLLGIVNETYQSLLSENVLAALGQKRNPQGHYSNRVKFSQKDIENLREADVETLLENASNGAYHDGSYIPLRRNTPQALMEILGQHSGEAIEDLPVIMNVGKVRQAMEEGEYAGGRGHGISREGMMAIIKGMDDPAYIVEQENGRYVEVVRYYDGQKRAAWAVLDFGNLKNAEYMNGYEGGQYHVLVTAFEPDNLKRYLSHNVREILYDKRKDALQRGSGRLWPSHLNRTPFADSIPSGQAQGKEKPKFSLKEGMTEGERYEALKDAELQVPRYDGEASKLTEAEAERLARSTRRDARRYAKTLYEKFGLGKQYVNRAADIEFEFSGRGFDKSVYEQNARTADYASFGKMLASLERIIENAIPLEIHGDKYRGTHRADPLLERVYVLVSAYEDGGIVPIQLEVKEYQEQDNQLYVAVTLNKIEAGVFTTAQHFQHEAGVLSVAVPGFNLSLRELFANINPEDGEMLKYVPDGFLDRAQRAAKARALEREKAKMEGLKKLRFSLKDTAEVDTRALLAENERLRGALESLKAQFKLTGGHRIKPESVNRLAGRLLRQARSSYDRATLVENLTRMFDYLGNAENPAWEELAQMGTGLIRRVLERSSEIDQESYGLYAEPRAYLKETAIRLSESQREEAAAVAGSYRDYRVLVGRSVKLGNQGTSLDEAWQALSAMAPWLFDPEAAEGDQVAQLADIVEMMQPQYVNPYGYDIDEAAYDLFLWVYNQYFDLPEVRTYADRQAQKMTRLKGEFARRLQEGREAAKARLEAAQAAYRAERAEDDLLRRWLAAKDANEQKMRRDAAAERFRERLARKEGELLQARAKARARRQAMADTEVKQKLRKRIERTSRELSGWLLKPSEKQYVPDHLRRAVAGFLETIDLTGKEGADTKKAQKWRERMMDVTQAMRNIDTASGIAEQAAGYDTAFIDFDEGDVARMEAFTTANQGTNTLMEMDAAQLKELDFLMRNIRRTITEANRNHANRRYATVEAAAQATMEQLDAKREKRALRGAAGMADRLLNLDQLDSFSFFRQLGPAAESVLEGLRRGFDQKVLRTREAMEYMKEAAEGAGLRKVSGLGAQTHTFQVTGGELTLTTAQIMELYLLNKREQARRHLYSGGIRPAETTVRAGRKTITLRKTAPVQVTEADVEQITAVLTPEQARLADRMQRFLSHQAAAWGNGASMELKGYKRFTEKDYYPIHSDGHYLLTQDPQRKEGLNAIRNYGWTKPAAQHAGNAIILGDVFDTFTRHVDEMATYSAFAAPLSDAMKWLNYRGLDQEGRPVSVKQSIARAYGQDAVRYIVKFLQDLNGISKAEDGPGLASLLLRNAKVAAVAANLRVVLQQPTAYLRAAAELDAQYLLKAAARKPAVAKAQQYAPIALWKSWGFFELDTGKSMRDIIVGSQSAKSRAQEKALWLAGKADDITWGALWNACELETLDKQPQLAPGSEAFNQAVGLRLSQVVDATQVVDSVFHRSQIMRSKNGLTGLYTSFMAEPTKSYNMLRNAIMDYREKPGKDSALRLARVGLTFAATAMATAAAAALADAFRDDKEEDEDGRARGFGRKWLEAFAANAIDGLNPLNLIPGAKDVMSMLDGYDPSRMDLQALSKLMSAAEGLILYLRGESRYNAYKITYDITQALSSLTGLPVGNLMRTLNSLYNTVSPEGIDWYNETATPAIAYENLYQAILEQDEAKEARIRKKLAQDKDAPKAPADIDAGIAKVMMEYDSRVIRAYEAREATDTQNVRRLKREIMEDGFTGEMVDKAIGLYAASLKEPGEKELDKKLDAKLYSYEHLYRAIRAAADSGRYDSVADIRKELEADSEAGDPAAAVKSKVSSEMRKDYVAFVNAGKDQQADALAAVLKDQFGFEDSDLRRWVLDSRRDSTVQAIDAGDIAAANRYIDGQKELGREDKDIAQSLRSLYRDQIVQLYNEGKTEEMNNLVARLSRLKLYNQDGSRCFTAKKAQEWIDAAKKKARAQEQRK